MIPRGDSELSPSLGYRRSFVHTKEVRVAADLALTN